MTAWRMSGDKNGSRSLVLYQGSCPFVQDAATVALGASKAKGCAAVQGPLDGKTSQVFDVNGEGYTLVSVHNEIHLVHITSPGKSAADLDGICVGEKPVSAVSSLAFGSSAPIIRTADNGGLLLSDTAIGRRADGTWVLFAKGFPQNQSCQKDSMCELCARGIYRTTSTDLIHWSDFEQVVKQGSVPEAVTTGDGTVWLYWQDFTETCASGNVQNGATSPVSGAYELPGTYALSEPIEVEFSGGSQLNDGLNHPPTNGNPIYLPDARAVAALDKCVEMGPAAAAAASTKPAPFQQNKSGQSTGGSSPKSKAGKAQTPGRGGKAPMKPHGGKPRKPDASGS